jgi:putative transposase
MTDNTYHRAYVFVLDPTPQQEQQLHSHAGGARFAYNHMLALVKATLDQRAAEKTYGVPDDQLTPHLNWSHYALRKVWNARKDVAAPWWNENSKEAYSNALAGLSSGLKNWSDSRKGKRKGKPVEFPKFHGKGSKKSFSITTGVMRLEPSRHHVTLPKIGTMHVMESTRRLYRLVERGDARILRATVSEHRGRWQVSLLAELPKPAPRADKSRVVGVDVGCKDWIVAATSDGTEVLRVPVPEQLAELDKTKRRLQRRNRNRQAPDKSTGQKASNRWRKAQRRINRCDWRMAAVREDTLHKVTTELAAKFDTVVIEDLNVAGMMTRGGAYKKGLNRSVARAGMSMSRTMIGYKANNTVMANRWFPSSKTCSSCGSVKAKLTLGERTYVCDHPACGHVMDRDLNAAVNLAKYGELSITAGSPLVAGRGAKRKTASPSGDAAAGVEASTLISGRVSLVTATSAQLSLFDG